MHTCHSPSLFSSSQEGTDRGEGGPDHGGVFGEADLPEEAGGRARLPRDPEAICDEREEPVVTAAASCWKEIAEIEGMLRQVQVSQREAEFQCSVAEMEGEDAQVMQKLLNQLSAQPFKESSSALERR